MTELRNGQYPFVAEKVKKHVLPVSIDHIITGAAVGVDTLCHYVSYAYKREARHTIIVPNGRHNFEVVQFAIAMDLDVIEMPGGTDHLDRNSKMINMADLLVAFPGTKNELLRGSGTWSTIRRARKKGILIYIYPLNGDKHWKENSTL